ncbi:MAG: ASKHA domain-containing protein, partial [Candidatus Bipolaricaulota bacterium]|nr:ASKHA domain-containing protein [Candidatus Bipolaricaulota bacterium]
MLEVTRRKTRITILPEKREIPVSVGENLLDVLRRNGFDIPSPCNGAGTCGQCRIRFEQGVPTPADGDRRFLNSQEIQDGWRLSCLHGVEGETAIYLTTQTGQLDAKAQKDSPMEGGEIDPGIDAHFLQLSPPGRDDQRADLLRLQERLGQELTVPLPVLRKLPSILRNNEFSLTVIKAEKEVLALLPNDHSHEIYGVAIDIGTTTLACYLFELVGGRQLAVAAGSNPQRTFGADVISRIGYVREQKKGSEELRRLVVDALNELISSMAREAGIERDAVYKVTVVGNPTMLHLFLGIDPSGIDHSPYVPVIQDGLTLRGEEVGLAVSPFAKVEILPAVSAYVGSDIVAGILYAGMGTKDKIELLLDIGTNGEVALAVGSRIFACSTAAGPAFEGASISQGMSALDGAIHRVSIEDGGLSCSVIGGKEARGICGSGLLDAVAALREIGLIDSSGRLCRTEHPLVTRIEGEGTRARFLLSDGVYLTQKDIREFQLAKAAIRAGIEVMLEHASIGSDDIDRILVGGAFGSSLSPSSLLRTGLLPPIDVERIIALGNSAGQGAKLTLRDRKLASRLRQLAKETEYIELSFIESFSRRFIKQMHFPVS